jgi:hypothetical protein
MLLKDRIEFLNGISISFTGENAHREMNSVIVNTMDTLLGSIQSF